MPDVTGSGQAQAAEPRLRYLLVTLMLEALIETRTTLENNSA
jgi:hypothetical protein